VTKEKEMAILPTPSPTATEETDYRRHRRTSNGSSSRNGKRPTTTMNRVAAVTTTSRRHSKLTGTECKNGRDSFRRQARRGSPMYRAIKSDGVRDITIWQREERLDYYY